MTEDILVIHSSCESSQSVCPSWYYLNYARFDTAAHRVMVRAEASCSRKIVMRAMETLGSTKEGPKPFSIQEKQLASWTLHTYELEKQYTTTGLTAKGVRKSAWGLGRLPNLPSLKIAEFLDIFNDFLMSWCCAVLCCYYVLFSLISWSYFINALLSLLACPTLHIVDKLRPYDDRTSLSREDVTRRLPGPQRYTCWHSQIRQDFHSYRLSWVFFGGI